MDPLTASLITSLAVTTTCFLISELMPFVPGPAQGILQAVLLALEQYSNKPLPN